MPTLHVVIPVFNERATLEPCLRRVLAAALPEGWNKSVYLVDDHSERVNFAAAERLTDQLGNEGHIVVLHRHAENRGKGAALQTGFDAILDAEPRHPDDDLVIIQDADLEYDPNDYAALMQPLIRSSADAVLGTRWGRHREVRGFERRLHAAGNRALTILSNLMTGYRLTDMECCYKVVPVRMLRDLRPMLTEARFGIEPQFVAGLARLGARLAEVPVQYEPRSLEEGKKIGWRDGLRAVHVIVRERLRGSATPARRERAGAPSS